MRQLHRQNEHNHRPEAQKQPCETQHRKRHRHQTGSDQSNVKQYSNKDGGGEEEEVPRWNPADDLQQLLASQDWQVGMTGAAAGVDEAPGAPPSNPDVSRIAYRFISPQLSGRGLVLAELSADTAAALADLPSVAHLEAADEDAAGVASMDDRVEVGPQGDVQAMLKTGLRRVQSDEAAGGGADGTGDSQPKPLNWGLDRIDQRSPDLDDLYTSSRSMLGDGVDVYIMDSGVKASHVELQSSMTADSKTTSTRVLPGRNFLDDQLPDDADDKCLGHGTMVASQAAGLTVGVARHAKVIPVRVIDCNGKFKVSNALKGIDWILSHADARRRSGECKSAVLNLSGRAFGLSRAFDTAAEAVADAGLVFVVASGNEGKNACDYSPNTRRQVDSSKYPLVVAATRMGKGSAFGVQQQKSSEPEGLAANQPAQNQADDELSTFSNSGRCVDISAPGEGVYGSSYTCASCYTQWSGTSFACPLVSGIAAGIRGVYPDWPPSCVRAAVMAMATRGVVDISTISNSTGTPTTMAYSGPRGIDDIPMVCDNEGGTGGGDAAAVDVIVRAQVVSVDEVTDATEGGSAATANQPSNASAATANTSTIVVGTSTTSTAASPATSSNISSSLESASAKHNPSKPLQWDWPAGVIFVCGFLMLLGLAYMIASHIRKTAANTNTATAEGGSGGNGTSCSNQHLPPTVVSKSATQQVPAASAAPRGRERTIIQNEQLQRPRGEPRPHHGAAPAVLLQPRILHIPRSDVTISAVPMLLPDERTLRSLAVLPPMPGTGWVRRASLGWASITNAAPGEARRGASTDAAPISTEARSEERISPSSANSTSITSTRGPPLRPVPQEAEEAEAAVNDEASETTAASTGRTPCDAA